MHPSAGHVGAAPATAHASSLGVHAACIVNRGHGGGVSPTNSATQPTPHNQKCVGRYDTPHHQHTAAAAHVQVPRPQLAPGSECDAPPVDTNSTANVARASATTANAVTNRCSAQRVVAALDAARDVRAAWRLIATGLCDKSRRRCTPHSTLGSSAGSCYPLPVHLAQRLKHCTCHIVHRVRLHCRWWLLRSCTCTCRTQFRRSKRPVQQTGADLFS